MADIPVSFSDQLKENWRTYFWRAIGGGLAILAMQLLAEMGQFPIALVPFATSVVNVVGLCGAPPTQPRALIGGHLISTVIGLVVLSALGSSEIAAAVAVGLAIVAMHLTGTMHPPAGINPLIVVSHSLPWSFLLMPVAAGVLLLTVFAFFWHNVSSKGQWPRYW